ncbi:MAG: beta-ketoacyl-ACP synthase II [Pirellulaceae bacterium]|nr:beta-ketoacyl-ACP synthase II [Pirellulaceae bacterium]
MKRRVVVTGLGIVSSLSCKVESFWNGILQGQSGVHEVRLFDTTGHKVFFGGEVHDWDLTEHMEIPPRDAKRMDRFAQFGLAAGEEAMVDAGLFDLENHQVLDSLDLNRCGIIVGSGIGGLSEMGVQTRCLISKGPSKVSPMTIPRLMMNAGGGSLSIRYGFRGVNYTVATACASANNAIVSSLSTIQSGLADVLLTGGLEAALTDISLSAFANMRALSRRNDEPARASRPFDADRDGFVLSEGAGVLVFEELEHAKARGAKIYAEVLGGGATADAGHITQPDPEGKGAARAMEAALSDANVEPKMLDYINAHGTSTPLGDVAETKAIKAVLGDAAYGVSVSSTKSQIGHTLGASGGIELLATCKAIETGVVPPTSNLETPDSECDLDYTPITPKDREINYAISNSFGFGGHNACVVVGKYNDK